MANRNLSYHAFLSFRGETRDEFTCFLNDALKADGFEVFMDKQTIHVGDQVDSRIEEGIKKSMSAIIVFSKNYAFSTWCLDELVLILARNKNSTYFVMPIYYGVSSKDIKHHNDAALEKHRTRHNDKVEKWRAALEAVGKIDGRHVEGPQNIFIRHTVKIFREKLRAEFPQYSLPVPKNFPQGMEHAYSYNELESQRRLPFTNLSISHVQQDEHVPLAPNTRYVEPKLIGKIVEDIVPAPAVKELLPASSVIKSQRQSPYKNFDGYPIQRKQKGCSSSSMITSKSEVILAQNPLSQYLKRCPPDGEGKIVLYTNYYKGKASTIEDCNAMEDILEEHDVEYETRDVTRFKDELRQLVGDFNCPRLFVAGWDIGNLQDVEKLHKDKLDNILEYFKQINPSSRIHDSWKDDTAIHTHRDTSQKGFEGPHSYKRETWTEGNNIYTRNTFDNGLVTTKVEYKDRRDTRKKGLKGQMKSK